MPSKVPVLFWTAHHKFHLLLVFQILSMIEEAAGTRMYESKKMSAQKTIERKDTKLHEIETVSVDYKNLYFSTLKKQKLIYAEM